ncbi:zonular occludens toxin domain-containing protein, partial [Paenibacillus amylolyticus]|uniref:zonular occludens toxin domain-containing protein n=1 Tax=Paenibacillus amylolyticus TaxID=1451 RepID=UPI00201D6169
YADRFLFLPDTYLEDSSGVAIFLHLAEKYNFDEFDNLCLVVLDEAGDVFPPDRAAAEDQRLWKNFFKQSRKLGFDFILIMQDETEVNKTIARCMEYKIVHRKANNIFPFSLLPFTIFIHITYWKQSRTRLKSGSTIFSKQFSKLYDTHQLFGSLKKVEPLMDLAQFEFDLRFGNCRQEPELVGGSGGEPEGGTRDADVPDQDDINQEVAS